MVKKSPKAKDDVRKYLVFSTMKRYSVYCHGGENKQKKKDSNLRAGIREF